MADVTVVDAEGGDINIFHASGGEHHGQDVSTCPLMLKRPSPRRRYGCMDAGEL